jgi:hypothetical protein
MAASWGTKPRMKKMGSGLGEEIVCVMADAWGQKRVTVKPKVKAEG